MLLENKTDLIRKENIVNDTLYSYYLEWDFLSSHPFLKSYSFLKVSQVLTMPLGSFTNSAFIIRSHMNYSE